MPGPFKDGLSLKLYLNPTEPTFLQDAYTEFIIRNPKKGRFFRVQVNPKTETPHPKP